MLITRCKVILLIMFLLKAVSAFSDSPQITYEFWSGNKKYCLKIIEKSYEGKKIEDYFCPWCSEKWGLFDSQTGNLIYEIDDKVSAQKAYISNDGNHVALINDWPDQPVADSVILMTFYKSGKIVKSYRLNDIYKCGYNISTSISHFSWLMEDATVNYTANKIIINTLELKHFIFNLKNGDLIKRQKNKSLKDNSIMVYGEVIKQGIDLYKIDVCHLIYGQVPDSGTITFRSKNKNFIDHGFYSVLINNNEEVNVKGLNEIAYNLCTYNAGHGIKEGKAGFEKISCQSQ